MSFKYEVGQAVEYKPVGCNVALFVVTRIMPEEFQAVDRKYRIKSVEEGFERNVMECDLSPAALPENQYAPPTKILRYGSHR